MIIKCDAFFLYFLLILTLFILHKPGNSQWRIAYTSAFIYAVGAVPFKDNFWTTKEQAGCPYLLDCVEPNPELQVRDREEEQQQEEEKQYEFSHFFFLFISHLLLLSLGVPSARVMPLER